MSKTLLFIHSTLPSEGISGMVVFFRHFKRLDGWDIHIAVPEGTPQDNISAGYPKNFYVHTFRRSSKYWPPFSPKMPWLANIRFRLWAGDIERSLKGTKPDVIVSVLASYFSLSASTLARKLSVPFCLFVHDNWALSSGHQQSIIKNIAQEALKQANTIFPVTEKLVRFYGAGYLTKTTVLKPIPEGMDDKAAWKAERQTLKVLHAGTVNYFNINIFKLILEEEYLTPNDTLEVIYDFPKLFEPLAKFHNFRRRAFFERSSDVLEYALNHADAMLVYYGLEDTENIFSMDSFPSRFVEFSHTGLPIVCIAPKGSEFYRFLKEQNWPLLFSKENISQLKGAFDKLKHRGFWELCAHSTRVLSVKYFDPLNIQRQFLSAIEN